MIKSKEILEEEARLRIKKTRALREENDLKAEDMVKQARSAVFQLRVFRKELDKMGEISLRDHVRPAIADLEGGIEDIKAIIQKLRYAELIKIV